MLTITHAEASTAILAAVATGTLVQGKWHDPGADGRHLACLLGSIHSEMKEAADCPADLMPLWMAELTVTLFDRVPAAEIYRIARRYGGLVARWHALDAAGWDAVLRRFLVRAIDDAVRYARPVAIGQSYWPAVDAACALCRVAIENGDRDAAAARAAASLDLFDYLLDQIDAQIGPASS